MDNIKSFYTYIKENMDYNELLEYFIEQGMDRQTAGRLAEATF